MGIRTGLTGSPSWSNGQVLYANDLNDSINENLKYLWTQTGLNTIKNLIYADGTIGSNLYSFGGIDGYAEAYVGSSGKTGSIIGVSARFNNNAYEFIGSESPFVIIEGTGITNLDSFTINDCQISSIGSTAWKIFCGSGDIEYQRSKIYMSLFYGTNGTNALIRPPYIGSITAIKTNVTRDVGKRVFLSTLIANTGGDDIYGDYWYAGSFNDTSSNTNCSAWSNIIGAENATGSFEFPSGTSVNSSSDYNPSYEIGSDLSSDENDNPTACMLVHLDSSGVTGGGGAVRALILCYGDMTWSLTGEGGSTPYATANTIDYYTDYGIPDITATTTEEENLSIIEHRFPFLDISGSKTIFPNTVNTAIGVPYIHDFNSSNDIKYKIYSGSWLDVFGTTTGSGWTDIENAFDGSESTFALYYDANAGSISKTFDNKYVYSIYSSFQGTDSGDDITIRAKMAGSWIDIKTFANVGTGSNRKYADVNGYIEGISFHYTPDSGSQTCKVYSIKELDRSDDDTGWLDCGSSPTFSSFTALDTTPVSMLVKLSNSNGILGSPSINGFYTYMK